jgi:hypothetical protein
VSRFQRSPPQWQPPVWELVVLQVKFVSKWSGDDQNRPKAANTLINPFALVPDETGAGTDARLARI